jgi:branched-subunit amino acid aminotransferase/4-amino-4-deoxychorismate lyase
VKDGQSYLLRRQSDLQDAPKDPAAFYQKHLMESAKNAQKAFKLLEGNAQAITRSAERLQVTAEQAGKEIQAAFVQVADKVKTLCAPLA